MTPFSTDGYRTATISLSPAEERVVRAMDAKGDPGWITSILAKLATSLQSQDVLLEHREYKPRERPKTPAKQLSLKDLDL